MDKVKKYFNNFYLELGKYIDGIHVLNEGITEQELSDFENKYNFYLPFYYKQWLKLNNGGELFATPVGTVVAGILGSQQYKMGRYYLEDNFYMNRRQGVPNFLFIIARTCLGDVIGFDLRRKNKIDGAIILWNHETNEISKEWATFTEWLNDEMDSGKMLVNYDGSESDYFD